MKKEKIIKAASGGYHKVLLTEKGKVYVEGGNDEGQLGLEVDELYDFTEVDYVSNIIDIAIGYDFTILLREDGKVLVAGCNSESQLGLKMQQEEGKKSLTEVTRFTEVKSLKNIVSVAAGTNHSLFLREDGVLFGVGNNKYGQIKENLTGAYSSLRDDPIKRLSNNIKACFANYNASAYLDNSDTLFITGELIGGAGINFSGNKSYKNVKTVSIGETHFFIANKQGEVYTYGLNSDGQLGSFGAKSLDLKENKSISLGSRHSVILTKHREVFTSGEGEHGQLLGNNLKKRNLFEKAILPFEAKPIAVWAGDRETFIIDEEGSLWISGYEESAIINANNEVKRLGDGAYLTKIEVFK